jgi:hypothetical protein
VRNCSLSATYLLGQTFSDGCGGSCVGTHVRDGSSSFPFAIYNWTDLNNVRNYRTSYFVLNANLSSSDADYNGIGNAWVPMFPAGESSSFAGNFNGNNNTISDVRININYNLAGVGLFGSIGYVSSANSYSGNVSNLGLKNISVIGSGVMGTGTLAGILIGGTISNCYAEGSLNASGPGGGGLVGMGFSNEAGSNIGSFFILNSYANVSVTGTTSVGGLMGSWYGSRYDLINNSYATGNVKGINSTGGLIGRQQDGLILNSYATGNVNGSLDVGGLVGKQDATSSVNYLRIKVINSYATGNVTGVTYVGGLIGEQTSILNNSYATGVVNGNASVGGLIGSSTIYLTRSSQNVSNCYATGKVNGSHMVGGLVGSGAGRLLNSYSTGNVTGITNVGGLIGTNASTFILTSSYYDTTTSGKSDNDGRGVPKTTSQMKVQSTFQTNNWDFNNIWGIQDTVSYPYLRWQNL